MFDTLLRVYQLSLPEIPNNDYLCNTAGFNRHHVVVTLWLLSLGFVFYGNLITGAVLNSRVLGLKLYFTARSSVYGKVDIITNIFRATTLSLLYAVFACSELTKRICNRPVVIYHAIFPPKKSAPPLARPPTLYFSATIIVRYMYADDIITTPRRFIIVISLSWREQEVLLSHTKFYFLFSYRVRPIRRGMHRYSNSCCRLVHES